LVFTNDNPIKSDRRNSKKNRINMSSFAKIYILIIIAIAIEIVSPIPLFLSFGALFIITMKPKWFLRFTQNLYGVRESEK
jgi:hypothetical protein